jgi:hypothetical protein
MRGSILTGNIDTMSATTSTKKRNTKAILNKWADDTLAAAGGNAAVTNLMASKAYDMPLKERTLWKNPEGFAKDCGKHEEWYEPTRKIGEVIGLSALFADVKYDDDGDGKADFEDNAEEYKDLVGAAADYLLNVGVIATLLVAVQVELILDDAPVHDKVATGLGFAEKAMGGNEDGENLTFVLQQLVALWLLLNIREMVAFIVKSTKMYGALNYWCVDLETQVWFSRSWCIQETEGKMKEMVTGFCRSLIPYVFLSRGPLIAVALELMQRSVVHKLLVQVEIAQRMITYKLAKKVKAGAISSGQDKAKDE